MRTEELDLLTLVDRIITDLEQGSYLIDDAPDCLADDPKAFIFHAHSFSSFHDRQTLVAEMVAGLLENQMTDEEHEQVPENFDCAVTKYGDGFALYLRYPPEKKFDFALMRQDFEELKYMLQPQSLSAINRGPYRENPWQVCIGPIDMDMEDTMIDAIESLCGYHGVTGTFHTYRDLDRTSYFVFSKGDYADLLRNADMLAQCKAYQYKPPAWMPTLG